MKEDANDTTSSSDNNRIKIGKHEQQSNEQERRDEQVTNLRFRYFFKL